MSSLLFKYECKSELFGKVSSSFSILFMSICQSQNPLLTWLKQKQAIISMSVRNSLNNRIKGLNNV